jgi:hypothetical protein
MKKHQITIISPEPDCWDGPVSGNYAWRPSKDMPENAVRVFFTGKAYQLFVNGKLKVYSRWQDMTNDYRFGMSGREISASEYNRILRERLQDMRDGGIVPLDAMVHPAPTF